MKRYFLCLLLIGFGCACQKDLFPLFKSDPLPWVSVAVVNQSGHPVQGLLTIDGVRRHTLSIAPCDSFMFFVRNVFNFGITLWNDSEVYHYYSWTSTHFADSNVWILDSDMVIYSARKLFPSQVDLQTAYPLGSRMPPFSHGRYEAICSEPSRDSIYLE